MSKIPFLSQLNNEELEPLVRILVSDPANFLEVDEKYKEYFPNHGKYVGAIEKEILAYGGNTFKNILSGTPSYKDILIKVCENKKINFNPKSSVQRLEDCLLNDLEVKLWDALSEEEKRQLLKDLQLQINIPPGSKLAYVAFRELLKKGGFAPYKWSVTLVNALANGIAQHIGWKGLPFIVNQSITKGLWLLINPISKILFSYWGIDCIAGPAYRIIVPCVAYIAELRQMKKYEFKQANNNTQE